jgi:hypothetical protein
MPLRENSRRLMLWRVARHGAALLAIASIFQGQPHVAHGREMNEALLQRFTQAYDGSTVDPAAGKAVYQQWIAFQLKSLEGLPPALRDEVISGLIGDRTRVIAQASAEQKPMQLEYDRIWTEIWPIDKESQVLAEKVKQGQKLSNQDRVALDADSRRLSDLEAQIGRLTPDLRAHFDQVVSETTLDLGYAGHGGDGPVSIRLGRGD